MAKKLRTKPVKYRFQYAAKFICTAHIPGSSQISDSVLPGVYQTAVNIHNPNQKRVQIRKKLASPGEISDYYPSELKSDGVERVVCKDIPGFDISAVHGFEGFLVIESNKSLDVTAVYTAGEQQGQVKSIDVENVEERIL